MTITQDSRSKELWNILSFRDDASLRFLKSVEGKFPDACIAQIKVRHKPVELQRRNAGRTLCETDTAYACIAVVHWVSYQRLAPSVPLNG